MLKGIPMKHEEQIVIKGWIQILEKCERTRAEGTQRTKGRRKSSVT
jgi:hypothetical protein